MADDSACSVKGCIRTPVAEDLCLPHYRRRYGPRARIAKDSTPDPFASLRKPTKKCSIRGCKEAATSRGWCGRHYHRWKKHGDPKAKVQQRATVNEPIKHDRGPEKYGLTAEQYEEIWALQDGRCAVCRAELIRTGMKSCNIDHCHTTGIVRGILCRACNWGIGILGDDPDRLESAARYLRQAAESGGAGGDLRVTGPANEPNVTRKGRKSRKRRKPLLSIKHEQLLLGDFEEWHAS